MTAHLGLKPHQVLREDRADGAIVLRSAYDPMGQWRGARGIGWIIGRLQRLMLCSLPNGPAQAGARSPMARRGIWCGPSQVICLNRELGPDTAHSDHVGQQH